MDDNVVNQEIVSSPSLKANAVLPLLEEAGRNDVRMSLQSGFSMSGPMDVNSGQGLPVDQDFMG